MNHILPLLDDFESMDIVDLVRLVQVENKEARRELARRALAGDEEARACALFHLATGPPTSLCSDRTISESPSRL